MKVPVGVTTKAGYSASLVLLLAAVYAYLNGDRSEQTLGTLFAGTAAVLTFLATQAGRYLQAHALIRNGPPLVARPDAEEIKRVVDAVSTPAVSDERVAHSNLRD
jgi:hypothetical protein